MEGGVPAGTNMRPVELGCLTTRIRINTTTKLGKSNRKPRGIDMDEFPFSLIRLRKKDNLDAAVFGFGPFHSSKGGDEGARLSRRCTNAMVMGRPPNAPVEGGFLALLLRYYLASMHSSSSMRRSSSQVRSYQVKVRSDKSQVGQTLPNKHGG